jgi:predicted amidohydrolase
MPDRLTVACLQVTAGPNPEPNLDAVEALIREARAAGADFITTPENVIMMESSGKARLAKAEDPDDPFQLKRFQAIAADTGAWLLVGSLAVRQAGGRLANRSFLIDATGTVVAQYDKIHMFDVDLPGGESYRESAHFQPGERAVLAPSPWGPIGLTVCYDLRFAALYRALAQAGARLIAVPSAFTVPTGKAHWEVLIRARAIETGCFILAPAQTGTHAGGRKTYGHSLIVSPWGEILAAADDAPGIITAELDLSAVDEARQRIASLQHDRDWRKPEPLTTGQASGL